MVEERLVKVATVANEPLAGMWAESLESQDIPCLVKPVGGPGISGVWAAGIFEHELWVRESQSEEARAILVEYNGDEADLSDEN
jgi:hypothetical protein